MKAPPIPQDEAARIAELDRTGLLYSPSEERFDRATRLARRVFDVPIALVSLVAGECQWFKSAQGLDARETSREISFCGHAILQNEAFIIRDAAANPDFADNPLVTGPPHIRFYAGQPLVSGGRKLGTLCVIDRKPRDFTPDDRDSLKSLGGWIEREIEFSVLSDSQLELLRMLTSEQRADLLDPNTGTWNERGFEAVMRHQSARPMRGSRPCATLWIGIQNFDENTDEASVVTSAIAELIRSCLRPQDTLGVQGGGEFSVFLSDCGPQTAVIVAERIARANLKGEPSTSDDAISPAVCVGVAQAKHLTRLGKRTLFARAREALRSALAETPGTVVVAPSSEGSPARAGDEELRPDAN